MVHGLQYGCNCIANLLAAGMQLQGDLLEYEEALDNLHLDIVMQLLKGGADVQAVTSQVRPDGMLCISALLPSSCMLLEDMVLGTLQPIQPSLLHV